MLQDPFETIVLFLSILIVNQTLADGRVRRPARAAPRHFGMTD
jgi:hypothetical protein